MSRKKILLMVLLILIVVGSVTAGVCWNLQNYVLVDLRFYPRGAQQLDLREENITTSHYEKILRCLPGCEIQWNVPFQNALLPNDTEEITLTALSEQDLRDLKCFPQLQKVNAEMCKDYENLLALQRQQPELEVIYSVELGGKSISAREQEITVSNLSVEELPLLEYLPRLQTVFCGGGERKTVFGLKEFCEAKNLDFQISLDGNVVAMDAVEVTVDAVTNEQISLLQMLSDLKKLHIRSPKAAPESLLALQKNCPNVQITWEQELWGKWITSGMNKIDLSDTVVTSLEELDRQMAYFPDVETVFLGDCGLDNEVLAKQRDLVRDKYKLVWTVSCGNKLKIRTDATTFMPVRENVYYFNDEEAYNLRYCEDMVCVDIGHMSIHNIDFVEFMPNLEYLILAHTQLQYIEPIKHCKKLKFLELDWSPVKDLTPLKECSALEDLNLGQTFADFVPVGEMTWLKNLWMVGCSSRARNEMTQALPNTKVMITGEATVANGWRNLDNYYKMRDLLEMGYMSW